MYGQFPLTLTYHKEFLGEKSVKVLNSNYVQVDRKSVEVGWESNLFNLHIFSYLGCGQEAI